MAKRLLHVVLFVLGLLSTSYWIRSIDQLPYWSWVRQPMANAVVHLPTTDTLFFGSSRISYGVVPAAFDARMKELGKPATSFNAAVSGTWPHEFAQVCNWLLARPHPTVRRVVVELQSWDKPCEGNWMSDQEIEMHGPSDLLARFQTVWMGRALFREKVWRCYFHTMHTLASTFRVGQGPRILDDAVGLARIGALPIAPTPERGYQCVEEIRTEYFAKRHAEFVEHYELHDENLARKGKDLNPEWLRGGFNLDAWRALDQRLRADGITPIYVVMPSFSSDFQGRDALAAITKEAIVLEFDSPRTNPDLFDHSLWFDTTHFNRQGATLFSRRLADAIAALP